MLANPIRVLFPRVMNALTGYGSPVAIARNVSVGLAMKQPVRRFGYSCPQTRRAGSPSRSIPR